MPAGAVVAPTRVSIGNVGVKYAPRGNNYSPVQYDLNEPIPGENGEVADVAAGL